MCEDCELLNATPVVGGGGGGSFPARHTEASAHRQKTAESIAIRIDVDRRNALHTQLYPRRQLEVRPPSAVRRRRCSGATNHRRTTPFRSSPRLDCFSARPDSDCDRLFCFFLFSVVVQQEFLGF